MENNEQIYSDLTSWLDVDYARKEQKLRRLIALNKPTDNGNNAQDELIDLYKYAETIRSKIQEIEKIIYDK